MNIQAAQLIADALNALARSTRSIAHGETFGPGACPTGLEMVAMALGNTSPDIGRRSVAEGIFAVAEQLERVADELGGIKDVLSTVAEQLPGESTAEALAYAADKMAPPKIDPNNSDVP
jgi:hypothetical protein